MDVAVRLAGRVSVTVTGVLVVDAFPVLVTVRV